MSTSVDALRVAFERILATRMTDMPLNNPALAVATVGFIPWEACQVGVLIAPWTVNLVAVSDDREVLYLPPDVRRTWHFPYGDYELMGGHEPEVGAFQFCSLFSPASEFATHATAESAAREIMRVLFQAPVAGSRANAVEQARLTGQSLSGATLSRRDFLRGVLSR